MIKQKATKDLKSAKLRELLRVLTEHHTWLEKNGRFGQRADLSGLNLEGIKVPKTNFSLADMAGTNLAGADLEGADMQGVNLVRSCLRDANLRRANLQDADLSDVDLRGANLTGANLKGADLWRANLMGCTISPKALHEALHCNKT